MRIAVIGSGISGLGAAWLLSEAHEVTVFETAGTIGLSRLNTELGEFSIDVPIRIISKLHHKHLYRFYRHIGVEMEHADLSVCYCSADGDTRARFQKLPPANTAIYVPTRISGWGHRQENFAQRLAAIPSVAWFCIRAFKAALQDVDGKSFGEFLRKNNLATPGYYQYIAPVLLLAFSCTHETLEAFSAHAVLDFFRNLMSSKQYRLKAGSSALVRQLLKKNFQVRLGANIQPIEWLADGRISLRDPTRGESETFDHVVLAVQANQVPRLLGSDVGGGAFETFPYEENTVVVHTDRGLMPGRRRDWAQVNYFLPPEFNGGTIPTTLWLNSFPSYREHLAAETFQSFNPVVAPRSDSIVTSNTLSRAIMTPASALATAKIRALQGWKNVWFCGSYVEFGATLQEEGFVSAMKVAERLNVDLRFLSENTTGSSPVS